MRHRNGTSFTHTLLRCSSQCWHEGQDETCSRTQNSKFFFSTGVNAAAPSPSLLACLVSTVHTKTSYCTSNIPTARSLSADTGTYCNMSFISYHLEGIWCTAGLKSVFKTPVTGGENEKLNFMELAHLMWSLDSQALPY